MENTRELWEQLAELPGGRKDPFDDPYGPTEECLSDNDIVRMFRLGAETRAVHHLSSCKDCEARVEAFARVTGKEAAHAKPAAHAGGIQAGSWFTGLFGGKPAPADLFIAMTGRTLVYVPSECLVKLDDGKVASIRVQLITRNVDMLRKMNVYFKGPFSAESHAIVVDKLGYPSIELHNVKVSKDVVSGLKGHTRLTKQLEVRVGASANDVCLIGTSNVELRRAEKNVAPAF